jgi:hypothetical protein
MKAREIFRAFCFSGPYGNMSNSNVLRIVLAKLSKLCPYCYKTVMGM